MLLTKVTPGVGLLWFVVRREWRPLVIALGVTAAIVTVTFVAVPWMWADWISMVLAEGSNSQQQTVPLPVFRDVGHTGIATLPGRPGRDVLAAEPDLPVLRRPHSHDGLDQLGELHPTVHGAILSR